LEIVLPRLRERYRPQTGIIPDPVHNLGTWVRKMLEELPVHWRAEAARLRAWAAPTNAEVLEACASELEARLREQALEALTLENATRESGYSYSALQKMLARGEIENVGSKGRPRIRRADLPKKAGTPAPGIADHVLSARRGSKNH
jgi:hypothetical protein